MSEMSDHLANTILLTFKKLAKTNEWETTQYVEERLDGTVCLDGYFNLQEVARAVIISLREPTPELLDILQKLEPLKVGGSITEYWRAIIDGLLAEKD